MTSIQKNIPRSLGLTSDMLKRRHMVSAYGCPSDASYGKCVFLSEGRDQLLTSTPSFNCTTVCLFIAPNHSSCLYFVNAALCVVIDSCVNHAGFVDRREGRRWRRRPPDTRQQTCEYSSSIRRASARFVQPQFFCILRLCDYGCCLPMLRAAAY